MNARARLAEVQSSWLREISRQESDIDKARQQIALNRLLWNQQEKQEAAAQLADLESKLAAFRGARFGPGGEYEKLQADLMGPVLDKVTVAIEEEAKSGKYDYVLDKSNRAVGIVFANPANDITVGVLRRLGVDVSLESIGATQPDASRQGSEADALRNRGRRDRANDPSKPIDPNDMLDEPNRVPPTPQEQTAPEPK